MISEELKKIKFFGSNMKSSVTPDDPAFSGKGNLIPFEELKIYKRIYWTDTVITILPFCRHERYGYGFEVSRYHKSKDIMSSDNPEDPQMWGLYVSPETRKEEKHLIGHEVPCNQSNLSR